LWAALARPAGLLYPRRFQRERRFPVSAIKASLLIVLIGLSLDLAAREPYVPPELSPWVDWVLDSHPDLKCPRYGSNGQSAGCVWISRLDVNVDQGLEFGMNVRVWAEGPVLLPGSANLRPMSVQADDRSVPVIGGAQPYIILPPGKYRISGSIDWTRRPASLPVPAQFGLLWLQMDGAAVTQPLVRNGELVLAQSQADSSDRDTDSLTLDVFRLIEDDYPLRMTTQIELNVSGRPRLVTTGRALLDGFALTHFASGLPARINEAGNLEVQVTAGQHFISLAARALDTTKDATADTTTLGMSRVGDDWPEQEIWGFVPDRNLRLVEAGGAPGTDLSQVRWPFNSEAQGFLVSADQPVTLTEMQRGNPNPPPATITVQRDLWVNFAGDGLIVKDVLNAQIQQSKRLSAGYSLGRIEIDGQAELVNTVDGGEPGIELQQGSYHIESVSAVPRVDDQFANGWLVDAQSLGATLHLPPGWRLLWAEGVDSAPDSWLQRWSLWNLFVLVFAVVLAFRFLRPMFAVLALSGLLLLLPTHEGLAVSWLIAIGAVAIVQRFPEGRVVAISRTVTWIWLAITSLATLDLAVTSAQQTVYPQLEAHNEYGYDSSVQASYAEAVSDVAMPSAAPAEMDQRKSSIAEVVVTGGGLSRQSYQNKYQEGVQIQTGPGLPQWQWTSSALYWSGPVAASQTMSLMLASPGWVRVGHALTALVSVLVMALLFLSLLRSDAVRARTPRAILAWLPSVMLVVMFMPGSVDAAQTPSNDILKTLEERLTATPACFPECASIELLTVDLSDGKARLEMIVHAQSLVALAVPTSSVWHPSAVDLNGDAADTSRQNDVLQVALPEGVHRLVISGSVAHLERFELDLPALPGKIVLGNLADWLVSGVVEGHAVGGSLGFERQRRAEESAVEQTLQQDNAPAFVEVRRSIQFDLDWVVRTRVIRIAPEVGSFTVRVPMLEGESILDGRFPARNKSVDVVFGASESEHEYSSVLKRTSPVVLTAATAADRRERWTLISSNLWHVAHEGVPSVLDTAGEGLNFRPRNGETLTVTVVPTEPVPGLTSTVERVRHLVTPGDRLSTHLLEVDLRASQGGSYLLTLPAATNTVTGVTINGASAPIPLKDSQLALPVQPGSTSYVINWNSEESIGVRYHATPPAFSSATSNITTEVQFPENRWVLLLGGPMMGPAMLFWGVLVVVLVLAAGVARIPGIALTRTDALLLAAGLSLSNMGATLLVAAWLLLLAIRPRWLESISSAATRNLVQILTGSLTVITVLALIYSVPEALLSTPDMHIEGNGSSADFFKWFTDHSGELPPAPWIISLPMWLYRAAMLGWSLWLAFALIRWVRAAWEGFRSPVAWYQRPTPAAAVPPESGDAGPQ